MITCIQFTQTHIRIYIYKNTHTHTYIRGVGTFYFQGGLLKKLVIYSVSAGVVINDIIYTYTHTHICILYNIHRRMQDLGRGEKMVQFGAF